METENYNSIIKEEWRELIAPLITLIVSIILIVFFLGGRSNNTPTVDVEITTEPESIVFDNIELEAKSVIVWDINNQKELFSVNPESQLTLASLTKVMMAVAALEKGPKGVIVTIKEEDLRKEGDSGLLIGERWTLEDLINFSLVISSNDGAEAIASAIGSQISREDPVAEFVNLMNQVAKNIGLRQTYFINPNGLDKDDIIPGGSGSLRDMVMLFEYTLKKYPEIFEATSHSSLSIDSLDFSHEISNTNATLLDKLPGLIASKTGFTDLAGGNLIVIFEPEPTRPIILGVLGSSVEGRFSDIEKLYLTTLDYINK